MQTGRARWAALAVACVLLGAAVFAQQADKARTEALARRASVRLMALQREADRLASEERTLLGDLRKLEVEQELKAGELKQIDADIARVEVDMATTNARVVALQKTEQSERPALRARLVDMYKLGRAQYLRLLLSTQDVRRLGEASRTIAALAQLDRDRIASRQRTITALQATRATLQERNRQLTQLRTDGERAKAAAESAARGRSDLIHDIDRRRDLNAQLAGELQAAQQKLQTTLRDLRAGAPTVETSLPLRPFRGDLDWPVSGTVRRRFGRAAGPGDSSSNGMEIAAPDGADAMAIHDGIVAFAGTFAGFGNLVILDHGSQTFSLYGDLLEIAAKKGAHVDRGRPVGSVGPLPGGGSGLYFELRVDGQPVDPLQWLKKR
jgi:septal ring factor EnvC (AmiA/AmiB activator)